MKLVRTLTLPWQVVPSSVRWLAAAMYGGIVLTLLIALLVSMLGRPLMWISLTSMLAALLFVVGASLMSANALMMRGARQWCVPGLQRALATGVCLYVLVSIGVPLAAAAALGAPVLFVAVCWAAGLCAGVVFSLAQNWLQLLPTVWFVLPMIWRSASVSALLPVNALLAGILLLAALWSWWQILVADVRVDTGMLMKAMLVKATPGVLHRRSRATASGDRPTWLARRFQRDTRVDLRGTGPSDPVRSMRVALGGFVLMRGRLGRFGKALPIIVASVALFVVVLSMRLFNPQGQQHDVNWQVAVIFIGVFGVFGSAMLVMAQFNWSRVRWRRTDAELPLLALLPGLGGAREQRSALLHAALGLPLTTLGLLLVSTACIAIGAHLGIRAWLWLSIAQLGFALMLVALDLCIFGGRLPSRSKQVGVLLATLLLSSTSWFTLAIWHDPSALNIVLGVLWAALGVWLWIMARRGSEGLKQRPHPFLANAA